ncbi:MAG: ferrous iron transport protein A [Bacilli bacterium]|jgi:ferrous iron transport protein A|nr:ferrous iron transport protein A [Bacilli bacterium]
MVLTQAASREELRIVKVNTDYRHRRHLENLSIIPGANVTCLLNRDGDVVLKVRDGRIAINREFAQVIDVESLNPDCFELVKGRRVPTPDALARFQKEDAQCVEEEKTMRKQLAKLHQEKDGK